MRLSLNRLPRPSWRLAAAAAGLAAALLGLAGAMISAGSGAAAADRSEAVPGPVVLIGFSGVTWSDIGSGTPNLQAFLEGGAVGTMVTRSVRPAACPIDGWLAVSAGRRAGDLPTVRDPETGTRQPLCRQPELRVDTPGSAATVPRWHIYAQEAAEAEYDAELGLLGATLADAGLSSAAIGPGAAIALAVPDAVPDDDADGAGEDDPDGSRAEDSAAAAGARVPHAYPGVAVGPNAPLHGQTGTLIDQVRSAVDQRPALLVIDLGSVRDRNDPAAGEPMQTGAWAEPVGEQVSALDTRLGEVLAELPERSTVIAASLADAGATPHLQYASAVGPQPGGGEYRDGMLNSASTRQHGMVQTTDLLPTLVRALGLPEPSTAVGSPIRVNGGDLTPVQRLERLIGLDQAAQTVRPIVPWFFNGLVLAQIVLYGLATVVLRRSRWDKSRRDAVLRLLRATAVVFASVPAATFLANLVPWWRADPARLAVTMAVAMFVVPIALLALLGPWGRRMLGPCGVVGAVTASVLAFDALTGSRLMLSSLMGVQPLVGGRFYGFSNPGFALFATGCLLGAIALADLLVHAGRRWLAVAAVGVIGLAAVVVDGTPGWGSDFGGPPAIIPAFAVLMLLVGGVRITWRRTLLIGAVTVLAVTALSVLDWLRPTAERTHLGNFIQTVLDGGAWPVLQRKGMQNLDILFSSPLSALIPVAVGFVAMVLARPVAWGARPLQLAYDRSAVLRHGMVAFAVLVAIGFMLNDSGTVIPAVAATVAIPLLIAASVRALELDDTPPTARGSRPARAGSAWARSARARSGRARSAPTR